jgi:hypothetical protein
MVPNGSQWFPMVPNGSQWFPMVPNGSQCGTHPPNSSSRCPGWWLRFHVHHCTTYMPVRVTLHFTFPERFFVVALIGCCAELGGGGGIAAGTTVYTPALRYIHSHLSSTPRHSSRECAAVASLFPSNSFRPVVEVVWSAAELVSASLLGTQLASAISGSLHSLHLVSLTFIERAQDCITL